MTKNTIKNLPLKFMRNVAGLHGAKGEKWLAEMPRIAAEVCGKRSLEIDKVFPNLSFNFVASCANKAGEKFVLKIGIAEKDSSGIKFYCTAIFILTTFYRRSANRFW